MYKPTISVLLLSSAICTRSTMFWPSKLLLIQLLTKKQARRYTEARVQKRGYTRPRRSQSNDIKIRINRNIKAHRTCATWCPSQAHKKIIIFQNPKITKARHDCSTKNTKQKCQFQTQREKSRQKRRKKRIYYNETANNTQIESVK